MRRGVLRTGAGRWAVLLVWGVVLPWALAHAQVIEPADPLSSTRVVSYEHDPQTGAVTAETSHPDAPQHCLRREFTRDTFGNVTRTIERNCSTSGASPTGSALIAARIHLEAYAATGHSAAGVYPSEALKQAVKRMKRDVPSKPSTSPSTTTNPAKVGKSDADAQKSDSETPSLSEVTVTAKREAVEVTDVVPQKQDPIVVTGSGVALSPNRKHQIPRDYVQNPHRQGSYGEVVDGKFKEKLRIDQATPPNQKGPNYSHYHVDGKPSHFSPRQGDKDPGFSK